MMKLSYKDIDYKANFSDDKFSLDDLIDTTEDDEENKDKEESKDSEEETTSLDDIIYPLYLPDGTKLTNEETVKTEAGKRIILTFSGEKSFILVEENVLKEDEFTVVPTMGEPYMFTDTLGALSDTSLNFTSGGVDYYITSTTMSQNELLEIAKSISLVPTMK